MIDFSVREEILNTDDLTNLKYHQIWMLHLTRSYPLTFTVMSEKMSEPSGHHMERNGYKNILDDGWKIL